MRSRRSLLVLPVALALSLLLSGAALPSSTASAAWGPSLTAAAQAIFTPAHAAQPNHAARLGEGRRLTFKDDFTGARLDRSKWGLRAQPYHGNRACARPAANRVKVSRGVATLSVRKIRNFRLQNGRRVCQAHGVWDNAMIGTGSATEPFQQQYGAFAARIAFQRAKGMHGGFWLQGPGGPTSAEIDIAEHFGVDFHIPLTSKIHYAPRAGVLRSATTRNLMPKLRGRKATGWNVYSVEWSPTRYVFRINGVVSWVTKKPRVATAEQEIVLSLLTSDWELNRLEQPRSTMKVDWVRGWAG